MVFYHKGLRVCKTPLPFVACARKAAIPHAQIWSAPESDVVGIIAPGRTRDSAGRLLRPRGGIPPARPPRRSPSPSGHTLDYGPQHEGVAPHPPPSPRPAEAG